MSDQVGNQNVGFLKTRLISHFIHCQWSVIEIHSEDSWNYQETVISVESDSDNSDLVILKCCQSNNSDIGITSVVTILITTKCCQSKGKKTVISVESDSDNNDLVITRCCQLINSDFIITNVVILIAVVWKSQNVVKYLGVV